MSQSFNKAFLKVAESYQELLVELAKYPKPKEKELYGAHLIRLLEQFADVTGAVATAGEQQSLEVIKVLEEEIEYLRSKNPPEVKSVVKTPIELLDEDTSYMVLPKKGTKFHA